MPLSRLSARRNRDGLITQRRRQDANLNPATSRHLRLWEAIRRTREELSSWQAKVDQVDTLFRQNIVPREHRLTNTCCDLTSVLMTLFAEADLSEADRSLLGLWVTDNLQALQSHPFVSVSRRDALNTQWVQLISVDAPTESQLARLARQHAIFAEFPSTHSAHPQTSTATDNSATDDSDDSEFDDDDIVFDFGWHRSDSKQESVGTAESTGGSSDPNDDSHQNSNHDKSRQDAEHDAPDRESVDKTVSLLEQRLSVDRLFRQLARVLHPDREQDESIKAEKHVLMSQCLQARQDKDINTLLSLYCEHVGELPEDLTDESHEELIAALQLQLKQLQQELRNKRFGDPLQVQIVERYGAGDNTACEKRIAQHARSLDLEIRRLEKSIDDIQTQTGLHDTLLERRGIEQDRMSINEFTSGPSS